MHSSKNRFNIRIYGLLINDNRKEVLVSDERMHGQMLTKFPGGGLEYGEGTLEGLRREWNEELNASIEIVSHFYTTDFFQPSAWDDTQVISIYYKVKMSRAIPLPHNNGRERFYFAPLATLHSRMSLPIDKVVAELLCRQLLPQR